MLGTTDRGVHAADLVGHVAVYDGPRAVAVVQRGAVAGKDVDDHRLTRTQRARAQVMAIAAGEPAGHGIAGGLA